jgi:cytochrome c oxidase assembly protein subunit 15
LNRSDYKTARIVRRYRLMASITVGAVIFLILVGGIVRSTGSGLGCPDWPKCFGQYVPPTDVSELPPNYKEIFKVDGREIADFDPFKTWVEYVNRLIGVLIGLFALLTAVLSLFVYRHDRLITGLSILGLVLVIVQGGIGAIVVKTHLHEGLITLHMVMAMVTLMVFILALLRAYRPSLPSIQGAVPRSFWTWGGLLLILSLAQIIMGTQVREEIDVLAQSLGENRSAWLEGLSGVYDVHKLFYYVLVAIMFVWARQAWKTFSGLPVIRRLLVILAVVLVVEIAVGISMHHFAIPPALQPVHLLFATLLFSGEFAIVALAYFLPRSQAHTKQERAAVVA